MDESKLKEKLQSAIEAECTIAVCYKRIAELIKNGRIREQFKRFSKDAYGHREILCDRLNALGHVSDKNNDVCQGCKIVPESFSLIGALKLDLETTKQAAGFYKELSGQCKDCEDKKLFNELYKNCVQRKGVLERERRFNRKKDDSFLTTHCTPILLAKLWK